MRRRVWSWKVKVFAWLPADCRAFCYWMEAGLQRFALRQDEIVADAARSLAFEIDRLIVQEALRVLNDEQSFWWKSPVTRAYDQRPMTLPLSIRPPSAPADDRIAIRYLKQYDIVPDPRPVRDEWFAVPMDWENPKP